MNCVDQVIHFHFKSNYELYGANILDHLWISVIGWFCGYNSSWENDDLKKMLRKYYQLVQ